MLSESKKLQSLGILLRGRVPHFPILRKWSLSRGRGFWRGMIPSGQIPEVPMIRRCSVLPRPNGSLHARALRPLAESLGSPSKVVIHVGTSASHSRTSGARVLSVLLSCHSSWVVGDRKNSRATSSLSVTSKRQANVRSGPRTRVTRVAYDSEKWQNPA